MRVRKVSNGDAVSRWRSLRDVTVLLVTMRFMGFNGERACRVEPRVRHCGPLAMSGDEEAREITHSIVRNTQWRGKGVCLSRG